MKRHPECEVIKKSDMKKAVTPLLAFSLYILTAISAIGAGIADGNMPDTTGNRSSEPDRDGRKIKTGWSINPCPVIAYETDLGFQYGAMCDIYYYGDGKDFPEYRHKIFVEAAYSTKHSGLFHIFYDSEHLIKGLRLTAAATYIPERMHNFYGFNGFASPYSRDLDKNREEGIAYYNLDYQMLRVFADLQGGFAKDFRWAAGAAFYRYFIGEVRQRPYAESPSLYRDYIDAGLIGQDEAGGGAHIEFKGGIVYDTRDHEAAPGRGIWAEAIVYGSPDFFSTGFNYLKGAFHFRHYVPLWEDRMVFAYHLAYQGTLAGKAPFYTQQNISSLFLSRPSSEGLGSSNTLRGINYNRLLGDGYVWANAELRVRLISFDFIKQHWYIALNPFFDAGTVVQPYRLEEQKATDDPLLYSQEAESIHMCAGIGGKIAMNYNFILSGEIGFALDRRDGNYVIALGLNYIF